MNRGKFTYDIEKKCLVPFDKETPRTRLHIITDDVPEGIQSMVTKKWYTSKYRLRQEYKERGFIEIGNTDYDPTPDPDPKYEEQLEADVEMAYYAVRDGMAPLSELDKHRCEITNRNLERYNYDRRERDEYGNVID